MKTENTGKQQVGKFKPGVSGNPAGRPPGAKNKTTLAVQTLLDGEAEAITRKAIEAAKNGDMTAIRLVLDRIAPARKDRPITVDLPVISSSADAVQIMSVIFTAVANGELTPDEGTQLTKLLEYHAKFLAAQEAKAQFSLMRLW